MYTLRVLLRHRITSWRRHPEWGTGTVAGQLVLLALLLVFLFPLGLGSYFIGDVLRELSPEANALRLINGGMIYLVPLMMGGRFLLQSPPSERVASYVSLPLSPNGLLHGQMALSLLSLHTLFAVVLVGPVWAAEILTAWSPLGAAAWLATAILMTVVLPSHAANLLHLLLGRRPRWFIGGMALAAGLFAADALLGPDLFRGFSHFVFGRPSLGLVVAVGLVGATHAGLLRGMRSRLEVDRHTVSRIGGPSRRGAAVYRWIERTLPAGPLVALELQQVVRTRRLRGMSLYVLLVLTGVCGWGIASVLLSRPPTDPMLHMLIYMVGIPGPSLGIGPIVFGTSSGHADGLFAHPHRLKEIVGAKLVTLWIGTVPGTVLLLILSVSFPAPERGFFLACVLWWWGITLPGFVWLNLYSRKPVDLSASHFSFRDDLHAIPPMFLAFLPALIVSVTKSTGSWWIVSLSIGGLGLFGLLVVAWTWTSFVSKLADNRHAMLEGFRENEPI